jgi:LacI family transcriptional regulator
MGRRRVIGVAIDIAWPGKHHQATVRGILDAARERNWRCVLDPFLEKTAGYDGVIARATRPLAHRLRRARIPAVNVWVNSPDRTLPRVVPDQAAAGRLAAEHLKARGFRRFAFLGHPRDLNTTLHGSGFREVVDASGFPCSVRLIRHEPRSGPEWRAVQASLHGWIAEWVLPCGVFVADDFSARLLADVCRRKGLRLPDDVALVGFGNEELTCEMMEPALTSIEQGFERVGRRAVEHLARLLRGAAPRERTELVPPAGIVERASTDVFAVDDREVARALRTIADLSARPVRVPAIVAAVGTARRSLERRFRKSLGRTIHDQIVRAHVERAKRLLAGTDEPLKRVARDSGFRTPQQLSKLFRRSEGTTPLAFRRRARG